MEGNDSGVTLRPAVPGDAAEIAEIWYRGWCDGHLGFVPDELASARTEGSFLTRAAERVGDTTVAEVQGRVAGFIVVVDDEVEQVYVSADHRGTGVAGVLLSEAERLVRDGGYAKAWLAVVAGNASARRFYKRSGWSDRGEFDYAASSKDGPIIVPSHRYEKDVI
jgi:GNAT superfamily N-acetyltransferase